MSPNVRVQGAGETKVDPQSDIVLDKGTVRVEEDVVSYSDAEVKRLLRRLDFWFLPVLAISYLLQYWDKTLLGQAALFNLTTDLKLITVIGYNAKGQPITNSDKYSRVSWIFYVGYLVATYPTSLLAQRFPTMKVCAASMMVWAVVMMSTAACSNYAQLMVNRFFLGVCESAVAPVFTVYMTFWYTPKEQPFRTAIWYCMSGCAGVVTPLISWGIGHIHGSFGASTWKYMYLIAGATTFAWAIVVMAVMPDDPQRAKWINDRDRAIIVSRLKMHNVGTVDRHFKKHQVWEALTDFNAWSNMFFSGVSSIPNGAFSSFATLVISGLGYSNFEALVLLMPVGGVAATGFLIAGWVTRRFQGWRYFMIIILCTPALAGSLMCWKIPRNKPGALYAGLVMMPLEIATNSIAIAMVASNTAGHTKKATVSAMAFIGYCVGNILGPVVFSSTPGPLYLGGWIACVVCIISLIVLAVFARWYLGRENCRRDSLYGAPGPLTDVYGTEDEAEGHMDITDRENKNFRYQL